MIRVSEMRPRLCRKAGYSVTVVGLRKKGQPRYEVVYGVHAYRLPRLELFQKTPADNPTPLGASPDQG